jgi:hypothetical protein
MPQPIQTYALLEERGLLAVSGPDASAFLQGLITNDVDKVTPERAIYAALLTPQGKFLYDFFVAELGGRLVLDCEGARLAELERRLTLYRLRADVVLEDLGPGWRVAALIGAGALRPLGLEPEPGQAIALGHGIAFTDPRLAAIGGRAILPSESAPATLEGQGLARAEAADYDRARLAAGLPDGSRDMIVEKATLLESGFDELAGVDFKKGCFVGQELTARVKYRGLVRKRLMPVAVEGPLPAPGTPIMAGERRAGELRSGRDGAAIALLRLDEVERAKESGVALTAGEARVSPLKPDWASY